MGRVSDSRSRLLKAVAELIWTGSYGSTTIDCICEKARVQKGSFYHFFASKAEAAHVAVMSEWEVEKANCDRIFSPTVPPLERLRNFCGHSYQQQVALKKAYGHVLGCPLCHLGTEVSTREDVLRQAVLAIMRQARRYFESAIRDAHALGLIHAPDPEAKARVLYAFGEGLLTQARIEDDVELLRQMEPGMRDILGLPELPVRRAKPGRRRSR